MHKFFKKMSAAKAALVGVVFTVGALMMAQGLLKIFSPFSADINGIIAGFVLIIIAVVILGHDGKGGYNS